VSDVNPKQLLIYTLVDQTAFVVSVFVDIGESVIYLSSFSTCNEANFIVVLKNTIKVKLRSQRMGVVIISALRKLPALRNITFNHTILIYLCSIINLCYYALCILTISCSVIAFGTLCLIR